MPNLDLDIRMYGQAGELKQITKVKPNVFLFLSESAGRRQADSSNTSNNQVIHQKLSLISRQKQTPLFVEGKRRECNTIRSKIALMYVHTFSLDK